MSEYHYAQNYVDKFKWNRPNATEKIYVCLPKEVIHTNSSLNAVADFPYLSEREQDSIIASLTEILDKINDSIFLQQFTESMLYTIGKIRTPIVIVENESQLPKADSNHFVLNVVQLEAEEFLENSRSSFSTNMGNYYAYDYTLRHFSTNAWFKFDQPDTSIYFKNNEVAENFQGVVTSIKDMKATLKGHFDRINVNNAYQSARDLGAYCGQLYIEQILHTYVRRFTGGNQYYMYYNIDGEYVETMIPYAEGMKDSFEKI